MVDFYGKLKKLYVKEKAITESDVSVVDIIAAREEVEENEGDLGVDSSKKEVY